MTRLDVREGDDLHKTYWFSDSAAVFIDHTANAFHEYESMEQIQDPQIDPALGFLRPEELAEAIYVRWIPKHHIAGEGNERGTFVYQNGDGNVLEMIVDMSTHLPVSIRKFSAPGEGKKAILEARFIWDEPIPPQLMNPGTEKEGR
jgi:hypothetical protein